MSSMTNLPDKKDSLDDVIDNWGRGFEPATHVTGRYGMPITGNVTDWQMTLTKVGWKHHKNELKQALEAYMLSQFLELVGEDKKFNLEDLTDHPALHRRRGANQLRKDLGTKAREKWSGK